MLNIPTTKRKLFSLLFLKSFTKKSLFILSFLFVGALVTSSKCFVPSSYFAADDPNIQYIGRFDSSRPRIVRFDWPGFQIRTHFSGTYCGIKLKDDHNDYNIFIDGKLSEILRTSSDTVYKIAENLKAGKHSLLITKRTEALNGIASFEGFILNRGDSLYPAVEEKKRKIEFIGDSFVAGLGSEGNSPDCLLSRETDNNYIAFGPVLARRLNADYSIIAVSGIGIIRNHGDSTRISKRPMPYYYERTCLNDTLIWDFQKWQPDLVVIRLGNNDYWEKPYPTLSAFQTAYMKFLKRIRKLYPEASILVLCEPVRKDSHCDYIKSLVNELSSRMQDKKIWFDELDVNLDRLKDFGCQAHPNELGHKKIADTLEPIIRKAMNW
jgi:lysophospholipase L1-like esterase